jgi:hypothetical protein
MPEGGNVPATKRKKAEPAPLIDAFDTVIAVGDTVLFSTTSPGGIRYHYGTIEKVYPALPPNRNGVACPARVAVTITRSGDDHIPVKASILNACNVVKYKPEEPCPPKS